MAYYASTVDTLTINGTEYIDVTVNGMIVDGYYNQFIATLKEADGDTVTGFTGDFLLSAKDAEGNVVRLSLDGETFSSYIEATPTSGVYSTNLYAQASDIVSGPVYVAANVKAGDEINGYAPYGVAEAEVSTWIAIVFTTEPTSVVRDTEFNLALKLTDSGGNTVTGSSDVVVLTLDRTDPSDVFYSSSLPEKEVVLTNGVWSGALIITGGSGTDEGNVISASLAGATGDDTDAFTISDVVVRVWTTSNNLNSAREDLAGCGTQVAGLSFGGYFPGYSAVTEEYNGTSWSNGGNLNSAREDLAGCGTQDAGLSFGGYFSGYSAVTEEYNGTSWSSGGNLNTARRELAGCGAQDAGLSFGGASGIYSAVTEEYNGTSWSSGGNLNTARSELSGCGAQDAGLSFGGYTGDVSSVTEEYNGTSWSNGGNLNSARDRLAGCGTQVAGLSFGGYFSGYSAVTEEYNGTSWSSGGNLNTARQGLAGCGAQDAGLSFGGYTGDVLSVTEEYA